MNTQCHIKYINESNKKIIIKSRIYYCFNDIINIKYFDPNRIKIDKNSCQNIVIYYIGYITIKNLNYVKYNSVNPSYFILDKANGNIQESNKSKYLTLVSTDKNKDTLKMYTELWDKINDLLK